jgi:hypothetical protein
VYAVPCCDHANADALPNASIAAVALSASLRSARRADEEVATAAIEASVAATADD